MPHGGTGSEGDLKRKERGEKEQQLPVLLDFPAVESHCLPMHGPVSAVGVYPGKYHTASEEQ